MAETLSKFCESWEAVGPMSQEAGLNKDFINDKLCKQKFRRVLHLRYSTQNNYVQIYSFASNFTFLNS